MADVELKIEGLEKLLKALKGKRLPTVRIGILGDSSHREDGQSNAAIGACHEFGTSKLPVRSFLRVPLTDNLQKEMQSSGAFDKSTLREVVRIGSLLPWVAKMALVAEAVVLDAFDSGGDGKWPPSDMKNKHNAQTLVETGQLRGSITSEVVEGED